MKIEKVLTPERLNKLIWPFIIIDSVMIIATYFILLHR